MLKVPDCLELDKRFATAIQFFKGEPNGSNKAKICGLEHTFTKGGLHAQRENFKVVADQDTKIVDIDFSSYYAYIMLRYVPWFWQGMTKEQFAMVLTKRILAKWNGDSELSAKLKAVIAPAYGQARKQCPEKGLVICQIGQLILSDLLQKLEKINGLMLINTDTDGIIVTYPAKEEKALLDVTSNFNLRVKIPLEYQEMNWIYQLDRSRYVAELGENYILRNGEKIVLKTNSHELKLRGQTCVPIVKKAIADYLKDNVPVEETIGNCCSLSEFELKVIRNKLETMGYRWHVNDKWLVIPDSFSVYATTLPKLGCVCSLHYGSKEPKAIPATSPHSIIGDDSMKIANLDKRG